MIFTKAGIQASLESIRRKGWIPSVRQGNQGGVGNTLETELGIEENNLPIPNAAEWELKAQRISLSGRGRGSLTTLMHMEPSPTALRFVSSILLPKYGWPHQYAGTKYPASEKSFRQTIRCGVYTDRGFTLLVDRNESRITVHLDEKKISDKHGQWVSGIRQHYSCFHLDISPYWGFDDLFYKAGSKLHNCFYAQAESKKENGVEFFRYVRFYRLSSLSKDRLISEMEVGNLFVDFDARTGHNHGTKFRIKDFALKNLYSDVYEF